MPKPEKKRASILVVEDDEIFRSFLKRFLLEKGLNVSTASNGVEALDIIDTKEFDLVITDLKMPAMGGMEFLKNLREKKKTNIAVIILTAHGEMDNYVQALNWEVFEFLHKPIDVDDLSEAVDKALKRKNAF